MDFQHLIFLAQISSPKQNSKLWLAWIPFVLSIGATVVYLWSDYRRHRQPLIEEKPDIHYSFSHHLKVVVIPKVKYVLRERVMPQKLPEH